MLNSIAVPKHPISEQECVAEIIGTIDEKIGQELLRQSKLEELKCGLVQDLLTGTVRVDTDN